MLAAGPVLGVVHLLPLPGSPGFEGSLGEVLERAIADAQAYVSGGVGGLVVENYGDAPFLKEGLPPETVAALALCTVAVQGKAGDLPVGVNALRNDARAALGVAFATGASFIRVNVHAGVVASDQGILEGRAAETLRARVAIGADVEIAADVHVKHGRPLFASDVVQAARDLAERSGADAVIVSGAATGSPTSLDELRSVKRALGDGFPVWAGSGVTHENVSEVLSVADAVIVGTALKRDGRTEAPVDEARVRDFCKRARAARR